MMSSVKPNKTFFRNRWDWLGSLGKEYCKSPQEIKSVRFLNYMSVFAAALIFLYSFSTLVQFNYKYKSLFIVETSFVFVLFVLPLFNSRGWFLLAKTLGCVANLIYLYTVSISAGNFMGGAYIILATSLMPMILFKQRYLYTSFFVLHIIAFFLVDFYYQGNEAIIPISPQDARIAYVASVLVLFVVLFFSLQYFIVSNNFYELELENSKNTIEKKNQETIESITYAKRIQNTILPSANDLKKWLKNSFFLYLPKDIVAGDFYWVSNPASGNTDNSPHDKILVAICDCTGHGVPGAMVSVICCHALNKVVNEYNIYEPAKILDAAANLIVDDLSKNNSEEDEIKDGMDASIALIDFSNRRLQWAGANNPLWLIRNNTLIEIKPNKRAVGKTHRPENFTNHTVDLEVNDTIYLFTDGYADQFGGPNEKKFSKNRLKELLISIQHLPMSEQGNVLKETHMQWRNELEQIDDVCLVGIKV